MHLYEQYNVVHCGIFSSYKRSLAKTDAIERIDVRPPREQHMSGDYPRQHKRSTHGTQRGVTFNQRPAVHHMF